MIPGAMVLDWPGVGTAPAAPAAAALLTLRCACWLTELGTSSVQMISSKSFLSAVGWHCIGRNGHGAGCLDPINPSPGTQLPRCARRGGGYIRSLYTMFLQFLRAARGVALVRPCAALCLRAYISAIIFAAKMILFCVPCYLVRCVQLLSSQACHLQAAGLLPGHGVLVLNYTIVCAMSRIKKSLKRPSPLLAVVLVSLIAALILLGPSSL
jgi:hypothetical protein